MPKIGERLMGRMPGRTASRSAAHRSGDDQPVLSGKSIALVRGRAQNYPFTEAPLAATTRVHVPRKPLAKLPATVCDFADSITRLTRAL